MAAGDTPEVLAKIDLLIELVRRQDARIDRLEVALVGSVSELRKDVNDSATNLRRELNTSFAGMSKEVAELKEYIAEFRGEVRGRLDGMSQRISDVNARLPIPIAYAPPNKPAAE
ncbi:hypothetical protein [Azospirillum sp.]|uniref:hypothetical protein n=1 Tax=Azospirillum sp. TaxID=34012 RepID=UPI002D5A8F1C|nr:hypothetical protein [Azospirillum sp.]HYD69991.1 hypothetical protein [Azospirillum sp.]